MESHSDRRHGSISTGRSDSATLQDLGAAIPENGKYEPRSSLEARKARKREQDRMCQRRKREKDRENLRRLEARLNGLQNADESKTVLDLILRHEQDQAKIDRQVERLQQLQSLLQTGLSELSRDASPLTESKETDLQSQSQDISESSRDASYAVPSIGQTQVMSDLVNNTATVSTYPTIFDLMGASATFYENTPVLGGLPTTNPPQPTTSIATSLNYSQPNASRHHETPAPWILAGHLVEDACTRVQRFQGVSTADADDQHIILTACLHGWEHANAVIRINQPLWACLRQIDEAIVGGWKKVERLAALWGMWVVMLAKSQGPSMVAAMEPKFLRPRPSQLHIPHRLDIDYFVWPGVRERLVFNEEKYYGQESFLQVFSNSACFLWPFTFTDTYVQDRNTRLLRFSPELRRRVNNLNYWTIDSAFLTEFPEFVGDIPTYNSIPPQINEKASGGQNFHFPDENPRPGNMNWTPGQMT